MSLRSRLIVRLLARRVEFFVEVGTCALWLVVVATTLKWDARTLVPVFIFAQFVLESLSDAHLTLHKHGSRALERQLERLFICALFFALSAVLLLNDAPNLERILLNLRPDLQTSNSDSSTVWDFSQIGADIGAGFGLKFLILFIYGVVTTTKEAGAGGVESSFHHVRAPASPEFVA